MSQESKSRAFCVAGILLGCIGYIVFMATDGALWPLIIFGGALCCSFWGLWSWHCYQVRLWERDSREMEADA